MLTDRKFSNAEKNEVLFITPHAKVLDALDLMAEKHVHHLPVIEGGRVVGIIGSTDTVSAILSSFQDDDAISEEETIGNWYE